MTFADVNYREKSTGPKDQRGGNNGFALLITLTLRVELSKQISLRSVPPSGHSVSLFTMTGFRYLKKLVDEFQVPNTSTAKKHYHDLRHTCLTVYNTLVDGVRKGAIGDVFRKVLETSKIISETTMMEERMKEDINTYKRELFYWHLNSDDKMCYRIPRKSDTFKSFRDKKNCKAKDFAIEIVTKMYRIDQQERLDMKEIEQGAGDTCAKSGVEVGDVSST